MKSNYDIMCLEELDAWEKARENFAEDDIRKDDILAYLGDYYYDKLSDLLSKKMNKSKEEILDMLEDEVMEQFTKKGADLSEDYLNSGIVYFAGDYLQKYYLNEKNKESKKELLDQILKVQADCQMKKISYAESRKKIKELKQNYDYITKEPIEGFFDIYNKQSEELDKGPKM